MKKRLLEKMNNFLKISKKILKKKWWLINVFKQKQSINKLKSKIIVFNTLNNWKKIANFNIKQKYQYLQLKK